MCYTRSISKRFLVSAVQAKPRDRATVAPGGRHGPVAGAGDVAGGASMPLDAAVKLGGLCLHDVLRGEFRHTR